MNIIGLMQSPIDLRSIMVTELHRKLDFSPQDMYNKRIPSGIVLCFLIKMISSPPEVTMKTAANSPIIITHHNNCANILPVKRDVL